MTSVLDHLAIFVADVERSAAFYEAVFGFGRVPEPFHDGRHIWLAIGHGLSLHIVGNAEASREHELSHHTAFRTDAFDALRKRLETMGVPFENGRGEAAVNIRGDGVQQIYFRDPDGYWIEVNDAQG